MRDAMLTTNMSLSMSPDGTTMDLKIDAFSFKSTASAVFKL